jgi:hypothetical protein
MADIKIDNQTFVSGGYGPGERADLGEKLAEAGDAAAIREAFLYVPDLENRSEWGGPHHELRGDTLVVNRTAVHARLGELHGARHAGGPDWPRAAKIAALAHLRKHYTAMDEEIPPKPSGD